MGYSTNTRTLKAMIPYLDQIIDGKASGWSFATPEQARRWAYKIREAFSIAKLNESEFPAYAALGSKYGVKQFGLSVAVIQLIAVPVESAPSETVASDTRTVIARAAVSDIAVLWDAEKVIALCKTSNDSDRVHFPNANLSNEELLKVYAWCQTFNPPRLMFAAMGDVTVRQFSADFADVAWSPDDLR